MFRQALALAKFLRAYATVTRDPYRLDMVFAMLDHNRDIDPDTIPMLKRPELQSVVQAPARRVEVDLDALARLPEGTLGAEFVKFLRDNELDPEGLNNTLEDYGPLARVKAHLESTHDLWHVLTGIGVTINEEVELQAFYAAQLAAPLPLMLLSSALLNSILIERESGPARLEALVRGYLLGRRARPLAGVDWSTRWATPLAELRREFNIDAAAVRDQLDVAPALAA